MKQIQATVFEMNEVATEEGLNHIINLLRKEVADWRNKAYPDVTRFWRRGYESDYFIIEQRRLTLTKERLAFVNNVQSGILANFIVLKQTKKFSVLQRTDNAKFYHVHNITDSFSEMLADIPIHITTAIFNFNGKIICDGLITGTDIQFGKNIERRITEEYNDCKRNKNGGRIDKTIISSATLAAVGVPANSQYGINHW